MKLKKLLPIATILGTASIVTPLVTSCGKHMSADLTWDMYDGEYILSDKHLEAATHSIAAGVTDLNKQYVKDVVDDWSIFTNDYAYTYLYVLPLIQWASEATEPTVTLEYQMFNVNLHVTSIEEGSEDEGAIFRASFNIYTEGYVWVDIDEDEEISLSYPLSIDLQCKNIPYSGTIVNSDTPAEAFYGIGLINTTSVDDEWEFTSTVVDYTSTITKTYTDEDIYTAMANYDWRAVLSLSLFDFGWVQSLLAGLGSVTLPSWYMYYQTFTA